MPDDNRELGYVRDCLAARLHMAPPFADLPADTRWDALYSLLTRHRLAAHFFALTESQRARWPESFREKLRRDRIGQMMYGEQCARRVRKVLSALQGAGIPVIVLKGWAYIQTVYDGDPSQRLCEDVDILVRPRDVDAAQRVLNEIGCQQERESWEGYNRRYWNGARYFFPAETGNPANTFSVGFHWGLFHVPAYDARQVDVDELFARARPLRVADVDALELSGEDEIVYACAHLGLHHRFDASLFRPYELAAQIVRAGTRLSWETVIARARSWRQVISVREGLGRVERLWTGAVPRSALEALGGTRPARGERFVHAWIAVTRGNPAFDHPLVWLTFPVWWKRPLIFLQDVFPSRAYMEWRYGRAPLGMWPLLYFRRLFQAIGMLIQSLPYKP